MPIFAWVACEIPFFSEPNGFPLRPLRSQSRAITTPTSFTVCSELWGICWLEFTSVLGNGWANCLRRRLWGLATIKVVRYRLGSDDATLQGVHLKLYPRNVVTVIAITVNFAIIVTAIGWVIPGGNIPRTKDIAFVDQATSR
jgi:hypothetical protein